MSRRYASRRYAGGLGPSRIRTRIPTTRQLGQWVSLRKTLRFRVRLQLSQSRCLSLLLAMSSRVFLFFPPRGHEPPPTLRDRLNPNLSLYRHRFPMSMSNSYVLYYNRWRSLTPSNMRYTFNSIFDLSANNLTQDTFFLHSVNTQTTLASFWFGMMGQMFSTLNRREKKGKRRGGKGKGEGRRERRGE